MDYHKILCSCCFQPLHYFFLFFFLGGGGHPAVNRPSAHSGQPPVYTNALDWVWSELPFSSASWPLTCSCRVELSENPKPLQARTSWVSGSLGLIHTSFVLASCRRWASFWHIVYVKLQIILHITNFLPLLQDVYCFILVPQSPLIGYIQNHHSSFRTLPPPPPPPESILLILVIGVDWSHPEYTAAQ